MLLVTLVCKKSRTTVQKWRKNYNNVFLSSDIFSPRILRNESGFWLFLRVIRLKSKFKHIRFFIYWLILHSGQILFCTLVFKKWLKKERKKSWTAVNVRFVVITVWLIALFIFYLFLFEEVLAQEKTNTAACECNGQEEWVIYNEF